VGRGVLLDVARAKGVDVLDGGYAIQPADLDAACQLGGVRIEPGDIILVRTGQMAKLKMQGRFPAGGATLPLANMLNFNDVLTYMAFAPGLSMVTAEWFPHARRGRGGHGHAVARGAAL